MRPAVPGADELEPLDEEVGGDLYLPLFVYGKVHLLGIDLPSAHPYLYTIVEVTEFVLNHRGTLVDLPLAVHNILILIHPRTESETDSKEHLVVFSYFPI